MKKALFIILIIAFCLLIAGTVVFTSIMAKNNWDFSALANVDTAEEHYSVQASEVTAIEAETSTLRIEYVQTEGDLIDVDYYTATTKNEGEIISEFHPAVKDGKLVIQEEVTALTKFYPTIYNFYSDEKYAVVIKVPALKEIPISLKSDTGRIVLGEKGKEIKAPSVSLATDTGRIVIDGNLTSSTDVKAETDTGRIEIDGKVTCNGNLSLKTDTGRIVCEKEIEAKNVTMESDTGRIEIKNSLKTEKLQLIGETGDIRCTGVIDAGDITIETSTGDVTLTAKGKQSDYTYSCDTSTGNKNISSYAGGGKAIKITTSTGDITLLFKE